VAALRRWFDAPIRTATVGGRLVGAEARSLTLIALPVVMLVLETAPQVYPWIPVPVQKEKCQYSSSAISPGFGPGRPMVMLVLETAPNGLGPTGGPSGLTSGARATAMHDPL
jgi:hypothetical protein